MRKFWKKTEGFTLVELIVVIAILGILAGVGTVGYSGYVKKANMTADQALAAEVADALLLYYYSHADEVEGGSVTLSTSGATASTEAMEAAMKAVFGDNWQTICTLKYDGWSNTQAGIKATIAGSNFADENGNVNMELLGAVDNLTVQLGQVMDGGALNLQNFPGYTQFLEDNGIDSSDSQLAANAAVLYLSQSSMPQESRNTVAGMLAKPETWGWDEGETFDLENNFMKKVTTDENLKCTQFEALAMAYATMQGYCMQKDSENGNTEWSDKFAAIDLTTKSDGTTPVDDEVAVLTKLCEEFTTMVDDDDRYAFMGYLNDNASTDIDAYYGVIDGISENQNTFLEKLNGDEGFYASQQGLLQSYWDLDIAPGQAAVALFKENDVPQILVTGLSK